MNFGRVTRPRVGYPVSRKQAEKFHFLTTEERGVLYEIIDLRNKLTHEITTTNDPTMKMLVELAYACHLLARIADKY